MWGHLILASPPERPLQCHLGPTQIPNPNPSHPSPQLTMNRPIEFQRAQFNSNPLLNGINPSMDPPSNSTHPNAHLEPQINAHQDANNQHQPYLCGNTGPLSGGEIQPTIDLNPPTNAANSIIPRATCALPPPIPSTQNPFELFEYIQKDPSGNTQILNNIPLDYWFQETND